MKSVIIGIAGGTGSGKSTFTRRLHNAFKDETSIIYHDNYYRAQDYISFEERTKTNYDHPNALETDLLVKHLKALKNGKSVKAPVYDFKRHTRSDKVISVHPKPIIILEGILVLSDKKLRDQMDIKIFVEADADERILRRVKRDVQKRGRDLDGIIKQYLTTVKPMHYAFVEPSRAKADIVINDAFNDVAFDLISQKIKAILADKSAKNRQLLA